jgi:signal transduction histidine kinase
MKDKPVILVVDDQFQNVELLNAYLVPQGYDVVKAASGKEALEKISSDPIDLVLLDVMMPNMSGLEVLEKLRADERTRLIPVVMVTTLKETEDRIKALETGCDDFLSKPFDKHELLARVRSLLKIKSMHDKLQNSYAKLNELQMLKDNLVGLIVHDINNLLMITSINFHRAFIKKEDFPEDIKRSLTIAAMHMDELAALVSDFIDIGRIEEGKISLNAEDTDINALISDTLEKMSPVARYGGINLKRIGPDQQLHFTLDRGLVLRIMNNLILNAVKFTPKGGTIEVSAGILENGLRFSVKDTGAGIPLEYKGKVFEKFSQAEGGQANFKKGKGLGLTFCKLVVEAHGGQIGVKSELGKGSTFYVTLPSNVN